MNDIEHALLPAAAVSSKAVQSYVQEPRVDNTKYYVRAMLARKNHPFTQFRLSQLHLQVDAQTLSNSLQRELSLLLSFAVKESK